MIHVKQCARCNADGTHIVSTLYPGHNRVAFVALCEKCANDVSAHMSPQIVSKWNGVAYEA